MLHISNSFLFFLFFNSCDINNNACEIPSSLLGTHTHTHTHIHTHTHTHTFCIYTRIAARKRRRQRQKLETWKVQGPDSIRAGRRRSGRREQHESPSPPPSQLMRGAIHTTAAGLSRQKRGVAELLPKFIQDVWRSQ